MRTEKIEAVESIHQPVDEITEIWSLLARTGGVNRYLGQRSNGTHSGRRDRLLKFGLSSLEQTV
jgi:hypothetical protein